MASFVKKIAYCVHWLRSLFINLFEELSTYLFSFVFLQEEG